MTNERPPVAQPDTYFALAQLSGTTWTAPDVDLPDDARPYSLRVPALPAVTGPTGLSCPSTTFCAAVGAYLSVPYEQGVLATSASSSWPALPALLPLDAAAPPCCQSQSTLESVSCPTASVCYAVGSYWSTDDNKHALIETLQQ
jgi:hypothetical protein